MVGTLRPHCLFASETEGRRHANEMNLRNRENHGSSLQHMGWMAGRISPLPPVEGEAFFLTSPFIERACRERSIGGEKPTYRYSISTKLNNSKIDDSESASPVILDTPAQTKLF